MIENMQLAGYTSKTMDSYLTPVKLLSQHYNRSPDQINEEEVRKYFLYVINDRGLEMTT